VKGKGMKGLVAWLLIVFIGLGLTFSRGWKPLLGLDLQGGVSVTLQPRTGQTYTDSEIEGAKQVIAARVNGLGVGEPDIVRSGKTVVVQLPGLKTVADQKRALALIGQTGRLTFRPVVQQLGPTPTTKPGTTTTVPGQTSTTVPGTSTPSTTAATPTTTASTTGSTTKQGLAPLGDGRVATHPVSFTGAGAASATTVPPTTATPTTTPPATTVAGATSTTVASAPTTTLSPAAQAKAVAKAPKCGERKYDNTQVLCTDTTGNRFVLGPVALEGTAVSSASASVQNGQWQVNVTIKGGQQGKADALYNACAAGATTGPIICPAQSSGGSGLVAVVLDSTIINSAGVQARDLGSSGFRISPFTHRESSDLALNLRYGALPVDFKPANVERVSATLGTSSLHAGLVAGIVGLALVAIYVLIFYRILGLVAILSLATGSAVLWTIISYLGVHSGLALTLSGITGIIVSIGVAVDSNVVFYEHLREDIAKGRTFRATVNSSFDAAWHTIVIADMVSLLGAAILYFFTLGSVRGFAFYLGLSTILDLAASWFFMRPVVMWMARNDVFAQHSPWLGVRPPRGERGPLPAGSAPAGAEAS
jgi:preprotein translocase subunit SecD